MLFLENDTVRTEGSPVTQLALKANDTFCITILVFRQKAIKTMMMPRLMMFFRCFLISGEQDLYARASLQLSRTPLLFIFVTHFTLIKNLWLCIALRITNVIFEDCYQVETESFVDSFYDIRNTFNTTVGPKGFTWCILWVILNVEITYISL